MKKPLVLTKKDQLNIAAGIGLLMLGGVFFSLVIRPMITKTMGYTAREKMLAQQLMVAKQALQDKETLTADIAAIQKHIDYFERRLPQESDFQRILDEVVTLGGKHTITFDSIEPQSSQPISVGLDTDKVYMEIPIKMRLQAGFHQFAAFINELENFQRFMKIDSVKISLNQKTVIKHDIALTISTMTLQGKQ